MISTILRTFNDFEFPCSLISPYIVLVRSDIWFQGNMFDKFQQFLGLKNLIIQYLHVAPMYLAKFRFNLRRCHLKNLKMADILDIGTNSWNNMSLHVALLPLTKFQLNPTYLFYL